ncbi:MAG: hypothetical protein BWY63_02959 [Chloroflexi bacterium ADurb.Bin360]|nr:MAG: hypothetical protein BWY63_02959 [Chloroflexi bacterium ADurb.Bin360]
MMVQFFAIRVNSWEFVLRIRNQSVLFVVGGRTLSGYLYAFGCLFR